MKKNIKIKELFSSARRKVVLAPHYDDFILSLGGLADSWQKNKVGVEDVIIFSQTDFVSSDWLKNHQNLSKNITEISALRYQEELKVAEKLGQVEITKLGFLDAWLRNFKKIISGVDPLEFNDRDKEIISQLSEPINFWLGQKIQLFVPLAIRFHQDHYLVREALMMALKTFEKPMAEIFFYEDLPYADTGNREWRPITSFIKKNKLIPLTYPINLKNKLALIDYYPSQINKAFYNGVINRSLKLALKSLTFRPSERIYFLPGNNVDLK